jgi:hypothetical protein
VSGQRLSAVFADHSPPISSSFLQIQSQSTVGVHQKNCGGCSRTQFFIFLSTIFFYIFNGHNKLRVSQLFFRLECEGDEFLLILGPGRLWKERGPPFLWPIPTAKTPIPFLRLCSLCFPSSFHPSHIFMPVFPFAKLQIPFLLPRSTHLISSPAAQLPPSLLSGRDGIWIVRGFWIEMAQECGPFGPWPCLNAGGGHQLGHHFHAPPSPPSTKAGNPFL